MKRQLTYTKRLSKELNNLNLSYTFRYTTFKTYWCRLAIREKKEFSDYLHAHSFYEIHLCLRGWARFIVGGKEYLLREGEFAFVPKKCTHKIVEISDDFEKLVWGVNAYYETEGHTDVFTFARRENYLNTFVIVPYTEKTICALWLILQNVQKKEKDWYYSVKQYLYCLWTELARLLISNDEDEKSEESTAVFKSEIERETIRRYVLDNLKNRVKVGDVAQQLAISERQLFRLFQVKYGMSAREYIYQVQMEEAKRFLAETNLSVAEIAEKIGYSDRFTFDRAFARYEGMSPTQFRRSLRK